MLPLRRCPHPLCKAAPDSKLFRETACHHSLVARFAKHARAAFLNETAQFMPPFFPNASPSVQGQHPPTPSLSNWDLQEEDAPLACSPSVNIPGGEAAHIAASAPHTGLLHPSRSCRRPNHTAVQDPTNVGSPCMGWRTGCSVLSLGWWQGGHTTGSSFLRSQQQQKETKSSPEAGEGECAAGGDSTGIEQLRAHWPQPPTLQTSMAWQAPLPPGRVPRSLCSARQPAVAMGVHLPLLELLSQLLAASL